MAKKKRIFKCEECGIEIPDGLPECLICGRQSDLFPTGKHDGSLFPDLEAVDWGEVGRRNRIFFGNSESKPNFGAGDTDKVSVGFSPEKTRRFLEEG
ncbi:MAG: hypothetical protein WAV16_00965 [Candidatus Moraniibacteriota bacterium]